MTLARAAGPVERAAALGRVGAWDWLRVGAMLDVAALHLGGEHLFGGVGLPLFHMLSIALSVSSARPPDTRAFAGARARRLLVPWLFWSLLFTCVMALRARLAGRGTFAWCEPRMLLYGPIIALWFLPFTALASLLAHAAQRALHGSRRERAALQALFCAGLLAAPLAPRFSLGWPLEQWLFSLPSVLFGFAIGRSCGLDQARARSAARLVPGCALLALSVLVWWPADPGTARHLLRFLLAYTLICAALWLPAWSAALAARLRPLLLGVYILHPVVYEQLLDAPLWRLGLGRMGWVRVAAGVGISAAGVWVLRKTAMRRFL